MKLVAQDSAAFVNVPEEYITQEICNLAFETDKPADWDWCNFVNMKKCDFDNARHCPVRFLTKEICELLSCRHPDIITLLPDELKTKEICQRAFDFHDSHCLAWYIPGSMITKMMCDEFDFAVYPRLFAIVPDRFKTVPFCRRAAVSVQTKKEWMDENSFRGHDCPGAIIVQNLPHGNDYDSCIIWMLANGKIDLSDVLEERRTLDICTSGVKSEPWSLLCVPPHFRTSEICRDAVEREPLVLGAVPPELRTESMCISAVIRDGGAFGDVPYNFRSGRMCSIAVQCRNTANLRHVPPEKVSFSMCKDAVEACKKILPMSRLNGQKSYIQMPSVTM